MENGESISFGADRVEREVLNHYQHDSKAHPPFVCPRSLAYMHNQLLGMRAKHNDAYGMPLVSMFLWEVQRMYNSHFLAKGLKPVMLLP